MKLKQGMFCPLLKKNCIGLECMWFTHIRGKDKNTEADIDEWQCAMTWLPFLMIENSQLQRETGAAVESFRNEMVKANNMTIMMQAVSQRSNPNAQMVGVTDDHTTDDRKRISPSKEW